MSAKPFLKWAGGKSRLLPFLNQHLPQGRRLLEPFAGSAALTLARDFEAYWLNDSNADLINLYGVLQREGREFIALAQSYFQTANNQEARYYELRATFNASPQPVERAALFLYLNRHGFNGLCRYNRRGEFNVPFGRYRQPYFPAAELAAFLEKADRIQLSCGDFSGPLAASESGDVIYCDPPYLPLSPTAHFTAYSAEPFGVADHQRLAEQAASLSQQGRRLLISNHDSEFSRALYQPARLLSLQVRRSIAASASSRQPVAELLALYPGV